MTSADILAARLADHRQVMDRVGATLGSAIAEAAQILAEALAEGGRVFWCGNGGSAADSQHLAAELVGRFQGARKALASIALTTDSSILTAVANDYSFDDVFARQIEGLGRPGDVLVGISTSGNSENVLRAIRVAKAQGLKTVALLGKGGGSIKDEAGQSLIVPSDVTARIQEAHIFIGHMFCELIEQRLGLVPGDK